MDCIFIDIETTGRNPYTHQMYEFAAVPVIGSVIRRDLMWHTYIGHKTWKIEDVILQHVCKRLAEKKPGVSVIRPGEWAGIFRNKIQEWQATPVTLGGKNFASFDWQFMLQLDPSLRGENELIRYSFLDIGSVMLEPNDDDRVPSLSKCRERAIKEGAPISVENSHYADDDAILCAEIFLWEKTGRILYGEPVEGRVTQLRVYTPETKVG